MRRCVIILFLILTACTEKEAAIVSPEIHVGTDTFDTTQKVSLEVSLNSNVIIKESEYLIRWDWESDGSFDTKYSTSFTSEHQYTEPGEYLITVEVLSLEEVISTSSLNIVIEQGYSRPVVNFNITPETGNILTEFQFDASTTYDTEEELKFLTFSWDFDNNTEYEFSSTGNPVAHHIYTEPGEYSARLVVSDSSGLSTYLTKLLNVTLIDTLIRPIVTYLPENPTDWDTIYFNASQSYYFGLPNTPLTFQFKELNGAWSEESDLETYSWNRPLTGLSSLQVRAHAPNGFYNDTIISIQVTHGDSPPTAFFHRSSRFGNRETNFFFDAWGSSDKEDMPSELQVRWDFNGDGSWDTPFSLEKFIEWRYFDPGTYWPKLQVMDHSGGTDEYEQEIRVSAYNNLTGYIFDDRSVNYYGTVQLGNRWWMSENLRYSPHNDTIPGKKLTWCYDDNAYACFATGKLYNSSTILASWNEEYPRDNICPQGWRIPSAQEWIDLFNLNGFDQAGNDLIYGGKTDFNALYGGYAGYHTYGGFVDFEMDSIYKTAVFMSNDTREGKLRTFQLKRDSAIAEERRMVLNGYYSIRCIKDE